MSTSQDAVNTQHQNHDHYFKNVSNLKHIDVYRVLILFGVTDPATACDKKITMRWQSRRKRQNTRRTRSNQ